MEVKDVNIAVQASGQPTNKVAAAGTAAGALGAVLVAITSFVGPALEETLSGYMGPKTLALVVAGAGAAIGYFGLKYGSQAAAYNVLDKPNIPLAPVSSGVSGETVEVVTGNVEENRPE